MVRREGVRFLRTTGLSKIIAIVKIEKDFISKFQKSALDYLDQNKTKDPAYWQENGNRFRVREKTDKLISSVEWNDKSLSVNISHGIINAKKRGYYFKIEVEGNHDFVKHFYDFVRSS